MTCEFDKTIAADDIPSRLVWLDSKLDSMSRFGTQQDCLRNEKSWLNHRLEEVRSGETAIVSQGIVVGRIDPIR
jgi:hypothetical protein